MIPVLLTKPRPFEDQQRTVSDREEAALILCSHGTLLPCGGWLRKDDHRLRPSRVGRLHRVAARLVSRNSERVSTAVCVVSRDVVEILNAALSELGGFKVRREISKKFARPYNAGPTIFFSRNMPRRMRALTVPSGVFRRFEISSWVRPLK
jgi:hypothetical protein